MIPSLSTDQVAAFVELAKTGSLRGAAKALHITEQGLRGRLVALESRLGVELYHKSRGIRRRSPLTEAGTNFLQHAMLFLDRAQELCELFDEDSAPREVNVVGSHYLIAYVLIDAVKRFHDEFGDIRIKLCARTEQEVQQTLLEHPEFVLGAAAPYEAGPELSYSHLFDMSWSLITPKRHRLAKAKSLQLSELASQPLILYERGSTGRQHVLSAFQREGVSPHIEMEATNTDLVVQMVEAGLGLAIVPLLPNGAVTKRRNVAIVPLGEQIRPIESGLLYRSGEELPKAAKTFMQFVQDTTRESRL